MKRTLWLAMITIPLASQVAYSSGGTAPYAPQEVKDNPMIVLDITGDKGTQFSGNVTLHHDSNIIQETLEGSVPARLSWEAEGIELELIQSSGGSLEVELTKGGNRSSTRVSGKGSRIRLTTR